MLNCPNCGAENNDDYQVCSACGASRELPKEKSSRKKLLIWGGIVAFILIFGCIIIAGLFLLDVINLPTGGGQAILGFPNRDGEVDLRVLKLGQDEEKAPLLAEDVLEGRAYFYRLQESTYLPVGSRYGGFVPETNDVLFWYADNKNEISIYQTDTRGKEPTPIFDTDSGFVTGLIMDNGKKILFRESRDGQDRCYLSESGEEADRIGKGDFCWITLDSRNLVVTEKDDQEYTLTLINLKNQDETTVLDNEEDVTTAIVSYDGSLVSYISSKDEAQPFLIDARKGDELADGEKYPNIANYGFLGESDNLFYLGIESDGEVELQVLSADDSTRVASGATIKVAQSQDGSYLVYLLGDKDGEESVYTYSVGRDEDGRLERGNDLGFAVTAFPEHILIVSQDREELTLLSADIDGENLTQLYSGDDLTLSVIFQILNHPNLYALMADQDGMQSLYVTPYNRNEGFFLLEEWDSIRLNNISPDGSTLLFSGREDTRDNLALFAIEIKEDAEPVELDDDIEVELGNTKGGVTNAVFSKNGKDVFYTVLTGGEADDYEIRQVRADGKESAERIYKKAFLVDVQWCPLYPFRSIFFQKP